MMNNQQNGTSPNDEIKQFGVISNPDRLEKVIAQGADVNSIVNSNSKQRLVHRLAADIDVAGLKIAIKNGADVNAKDHYDYTALHEVVSSNVRHGDAAPFVRVLIDAGVVLDDKNSAGETALMLAIKKEQRISAEILIEAGADLNGKNYEGKTALMLAAERGETKIAKKLLQAGADPYIKDEGYDAAYYAYKNNHDDIGHMIDSYQDFNRFKKTIEVFSAGVINFLPPQIPPQAAPSPLVQDIGTWRENNSLPKPGKAYSP